MLENFMFLHDPCLLKKKKKVFFFPLPSFPNLFLPFFFLFPENPPLKQKAKRKNGVEV